LAAAPGTALQKEWALSYDVARVRGLYPTLGALGAQLEGGYGALMPETVIRAIISSLRGAPSQPGSHSRRSLAMTASIAAARVAVADLVGAEPADIVLGANPASLLARFGALLTTEWRLGDEVVLTRLDDDVNLRPWQAGARSVGAGVRWAEVDVETGELPDWQYDRLISKRTRLVTIPLANPMTGTLPDVRAIADRAHDVGAIVLVDVGAALPHVPLDLAELGADLLAVSATRFGGPSVAALAARPGLLLEMESDLDGPIPERFELSPLPIELLDGLSAAIEHLADLDETAVGSRRARILSSLRQLGAYEHELYTTLDRRLRALPGVTVVGTSTNRVPVVAFTIAGRTPAEVGAFLSRRSVSVWTGHSGLSQLTRTLGVDELGGVVQVGLMPHTTKGEIDQLIAGLEALVPAAAR
jgi:cysteine desulfurase family protein (TIGR01976 family)